MEVVNQREVEMPIGARKKQFTGGRMIFVAGMIGTVSYIIWGVIKVIL